MLGVLTGSAALEVEVGERIAQQECPWGKPSAPVRRTNFTRGVALLLARHGETLRFAPHAINYRANIHALQAADAEAIVAIHTVGGISAYLSTGTLLVPDQLVDYTFGRISTYSPDDAVKHIEFAEPFDAGLRTRLLNAAKNLKVTFHDGGTYACTQGPRLETAAEIDRLDKDGCDVVGMTAMPEAALARELGIPYASLCVVVNPAAGRGRIEFSEIRRLSQAAAGQMTQLLNYCL